MKSNSKVNPFKYSVGTRARDKLFIAALKPQIEDKILDAGCGLGYFTDMLSNYGAYCIGIDIDRLCIEYCRRYMKGDYLAVDLSQSPYPFPDNHFDKILCSETLEHIEDNGIVLQELRRILKPKGTLLVSTPCLEGVFGTFWKRIGHNNVDCISHEYHYHKGYTQESLAALLSAYGFASRRVNYTMVLGVEVIMGITKVLVRGLRLKKIDSQANALEVDGMCFWGIYKKLFPLLLLLIKVEQPLARVFKGHMIIMEGLCTK